MAVASVRKALGMSEELIVAGIFEAKLSAKRETASGIYYTLMLNPADVSPELSQLRVGATLKLGWQEVTDTSVQPIDAGHGREVSATADVNAHSAAGGASPEPRSTITITAADTQVHVGEAETAPWEKPTKRKFSELSLPEQAGIRCNDKEFWGFLGSVEARGYSAYRCITLSDAETYVRHYCGVSSRAELSASVHAASKWLALNSDFEAFQTTQKYAESVRR